MGKEAEIAAGIMELAMNALKNEINILTLPLNLFQLRESPDKDAIYTDGLTLFYNTDHVLEMYRKRRMGALKLEIAHIMFHGLLGHFEIWRDYEHKNLISTVMDIQVECVLRFLGLKKTDDHWLDDPDVLDEYGLSAYYRALREKETFQRIRRLRSIVESDDHSTWMITAHSQKGTDSENEGQGDAESKIEERWTEARESVFGKNVGSSDYKIDSKEWSALSQKWGVGGEEGYQETVRRQQSRNEYFELLREIVSISELAKERDNIDYAIYQYGLSLYGNVPLIEPMECVEDKRMDNLVIAIDTSGSCSGEIMEKFVSDTAELLRELGAGAVFDGIYLIQCDWCIQKEDRYGDVYELMGAVEENFKVYGYGGTDFRPVFERVEEIREEGQNVSALLYFSDGYGDFPDQEAEYPVYFIVPVWAGEELDGCMIPDWVKVIGLEMEG